MHTETIITERGQISVPAAIRKHFHLKPGMGMMWIIRDEGIFLMPIPEDPIETFCQGKAGISTKDLLKERQLEREQDRARDGRLIGKKK